MRLTFTSVFTALLSSVPRSGTGSVILAILLGGASLAHAKVPAADRDAVNTACASDTAAAKCGSEKVGSGLLKCLHAYKKANPTFTFSESCQKAKATLKADRKATKAGL